MWGKLNEWNDRMRNKSIRVSHELYGLLATPGVELSNLAFASDDVVWLYWKLSAEVFVPKP
jgi:hypothetical protein